MIMNIERLFRIHEMIENETTGTPEEFARMFNIKTKQLQNQLGELKLFGADVRYSRTRKTYYYAAPFDIFDKIDYQHLIRTMPKKFFKELLSVYVEHRQKNAEK